MIKEENKVKSEKGITMVVLVITVLLLMIVTASLATHSYDSLQLSHLTKLDNDIETLNNRVASYYVEHGNLPILDGVMTKEDVSKYISDLSRNDGEKYYIIDLGELDNITLNYGKGYLSRSTDSYIINEESHIIYYLKGIYYDDEMHYTTGKYQAAVVEKESTSQTLKADIGDYVSYTPTSSKYTVEGIYSGYDSSNIEAKQGKTNQTFSTNTTVKWRIYSIDDKTLTLISSNVVNPNLYLQGADGYNNAVYLLNYTCKKLYSNYEINATARSINIEDIEKVSRFDPSTYEKYGEYGGKKLYSESIAYYPNIFVNMRGQKVNSGSEGTLEQSEQTSMYYGLDKGSSITAKQTEYSYTMSSTYMSDIYLSLLRYAEGSTTTNMNDYWLASRTVRCEPNYAVFRLPVVISGELSTKRCIHFE